MSNTPQNNNYYWSNGAYCVNCGILKGNVINNNVHPIWHPACRSGCNSAWYDQEPLEYEETDEDRFYRELEEREKQEEWEETEEERFLRELEEEDQADWEQSQKEWEEERLQGEIWEREEMDYRIAEEHHERCCLEILARFRAVEY
jgi:hypothetical protein